ncbi:MAG: hypothetical protein HYZ86_04955 [Candidatus Omnitrophica bacterium]|nr:hypothetical protein [Candidatus Omnitrophota bacterium]
MKHVADPSFWRCYHDLPEHIQQLADKNFGLLKANPHHLSLHLKKVKGFWSVRVGWSYRALGVEQEEHVVWFWIGTHAEYDKLIKSRAN